MYTAPRRGPVRTRIVANLTVAASTYPAAFVAQFAKAGFNLDKYANAAIDRRLGADPAATLAGFRGAGLDDRLAWPEADVG